MPIAAQLLGVPQLAETHIGPGVADPDVGRQESPPVAVQLPPESTSKSPWPLPLVSMYEPTAAQLPSAGQLTALSDATGYWWVSGGNGAVPTVHMPPESVLECAAVKSLARTGPAGAALPAFERALPGDVLVEGLVAKGTKERLTQCASAGGGDVCCRRHQPGHYEAGRQLCPRGSALKVATSYDPCP